MSGPVGLNGELPEFHIITEGIQGLPGAQGLPGPAGSDKIFYATSQSISGHRFVTKDNAGNFIYADAGNPAHAGRVLGMSSAAANPGEPFGLVMADEITEPSWAWDVNKPVWLGLNGNPTQTEPQAGSAAFSLLVGFATAANRLFIKIGVPVALS